MSDNKPFEECMDAFARHEYGPVAGAAFHLVSQRMFQWLVQVMLISLQRDSNFAVLEKVAPVALDSFDHPWAIALLKLTLGLTSSNDIRTLADDPKKEFQIAYYEAASLLTQGGRKAARARFLQLADLNMECTEQFFATSESKDPEPALMTFERTIVRAAHFGQTKQVSECLRSANLALEIVRDELKLDDDKVHRCLEYLADVLTELGEVADTQTILKEIEQRYAPSNRDASSGASNAIAGMGASIAVAVNAPLADFKGVLKQINTDRLSLLQRTAILFGFPFFLGRPPAMEGAENPVWEELRKAGIEGDDKGSPFARRRFSGDASQEFPRARYHAVCVDESGADNRTLIQELNAYTYLQLTGYCAARSTKNHAEVELVFRGLPGEPNPLAEAIANPDRYDHYFKPLPNEAAVLREALRSSELVSAVTDETEFVVPLTCSVTHCEIRRCLDLRRPEARTWTIQFFNHPPQGLIGEALRALADAHRFDLGTITSWADLMPVLNARSFGGNPLTDMFGVFLRHIGCEALIYPSARSDYLAYVEDGELKYSWGWNLVDYRGATGSGRITLDFGNPIAPLAGQHHFEEPTEGRHAGSIAFYGNTLFSRIQSEIVYRERVVLDAAEWRMKHQQGEVFVRGSLWYKKRYAISDHAPVFICDGCNERFEDEGVEIRPICPKCEYPGDV